MENLAWIISKHISHKLLKEVQKHNLHLNLKHIQADFAGRGRMLGYSNQAQSWGLPNHRGE